MIGKIWDSLFPLSVYYQSRSFIVLTTCASWPNIERVFDATLRQKKNVYFITMDWGATNEKSVDFWEKMIPYRDLVFFLSNDHITHKKRLEAGLRSYLINHNSWINENVFVCTNEKRVYDAVLTARAKKWKRIYLSGKIDNLALVINRWGIDWHSGENDNSYLEIPAKYLNDRKLKKDELSRLYNISKVGLILSASEGASYTSSEYLLCGAPVVSTKPEDGIGLGGREFWYTDENHIMCDPNECAVHDSVYSLINKQISPERIRSKHIALMNKQRLAFLEQVIGPLFSENKPGFDIETYFYQTLFDPGTMECSLKCEGKSRSWGELNEIFQDE